MKTDFFLLSMSLVLTALSSGCGDCTEASEDADAFVNNPDNQQCETTADCVIENAACSEMTTAFCGQVALSATAAASEEWADLKNGLDACPDSCSVCAAQRNPSCEDGLCARPAE